MTFASSHQHAPSPPTCIFTAGPSRSSLVLAHRYLQHQIPNPDSRHTHDQMAADLGVAGQGSHAEQGAVRSLRRFAVACQLVPIHRHSNALLAGSALLATNPLEDDEIDRLEVQLREFSVSQNSERMITYTAATLRVAGRIAGSRAQLEVGMPSVVALAYASQGRQREDQLPARWHRRTARWVDDPCPTGGCVSRCC